MNIQRISVRKSKIIIIISIILGVIVLFGNFSFNNLLPYYNTIEESKINPAYVPLLPWEDNGTAICIADYDQSTPVMCSDGGGGVIIAWRDYRSGSNWDIYAQRFSSTGEVMWDPNGIPLCTETNHQYDPQICSDGSGGAIIAWRDKRGLDDIYGQRVSSAGEALWAANGTQLFISSYGQLYGGYFKICSGDNGGAFIIFSYGSTYHYYDLYIQKINTIGETQWGPLGKPVCNLFMDQIYPQILIDGLGGVFITWIDQRGGWYIYGQRINSNGDMLWTKNGSSLTGNRNCYAHQICSDGEDGILVSAHIWVTGKDYDIIAQKVNSTGDRQWGPGGLVVCSETAHQGYTSICNDGEGGAILAWRDPRNWANTENDIYAQRVNSSGNIMWTPGGTAICALEYNQDSPRVCSDGEGGAIIVWHDDRAGDYKYRDIYGQNINSDGNPLWKINGKPISNAIDRQTNPIMHDGLNGEVFVVWWDNRSFSSWDIYLQYMKKDLDSPVITVNFPHQGDKFGKVAPDFNLSINEWIPDTIWYTVDNGTTNKTTTANNKIDQTLWDSLDNGTVNLKFYANDSVGNVGFKEIKIFKDISSPTITINSPSLEEEFIEFPPIFNISIDENDIHSTWYTIDHGITNFTFVGLVGAIDNNMWFSMPDGPITIQFYANDSVGNIGFELIVVIKNAYPLSLPSIYINSPENIIYGEPMSGYYPGVYGFEDEMIGTTGTDIQFVDSWNGAPTSASIESEIGGHKNVLREEYSGGAHGDLFHYFDTNHISGQYEFWFRCGNPITVSQFLFMEGGLAGPHPQVRDGYFNYYDGAQHNLIPCNPDQWYHLKFEWYSNNTFDMYVDSTKILDGGANLNNMTLGPDRIRLTAYAVTTNYYDAVGYSWDPSYVVGDNMNEGLLLSFISQYQLEWIAYSLDGQNNVSILGNTVLKMPDDGLHGIQVFGNVSSGKNFHSDIKYFVIERFLYILNLEIVELSFSTESFNVTFYIYNETYSGIDYSIIQIWWDGTDVSTDLQNLGEGLYFISLDPITVAIGEDPILLNMIILTEGYQDKYFETYLNIKPSLYVEITENSYSIDHFNLTCFICDETGQGIDTATIQMWWDGTDVSNDVINIGNGYYFISLEAITVAPGEDPILLNMTVSAEGYEDKPFETYIAVDPDVLDKVGRRTASQFPLALTIIVVSSIIGGIGATGAILFLLRKRKQINVVE